MAGSYQFRVYTQEFSDKNYDLNCLILLKHSKSKVEK